MILDAGRAQVPDTCVPVGESGVAGAIAHLAAGRAVVLRGSGPTEADRLAFAATHATQPLATFTVRHPSGFVRMAVSEDDCDRLGLPPMCRSQPDGSQLRCSAGLDAIAGISWGYPWA